MANIDEHGNKIAQIVPSKNAFSRLIRQWRINLASQQDNGMHPNKNICDICGFHIRSENHLKGAHHNGRVAPCRR